jgi:8-oxo-dGTP diphosphatase
MIGSPTPSVPARIMVAAGLITDDQGRVLITRRRADQPHPLAWEFPGGKIEPGESPVQALVRELQEEIGVAVEVGRIWDVLHHDYGSFEVIMLVYHCWPGQGQRAKCLEVKELAWCAPAELGAYDMLPADRPLIVRLLDEGVPLALAGGAASAPASSAY